MLIPGTVTLLASVYGFVLVITLLERRLVHKGLPVGERMLAEQPWRPVAARVVRENRGWVTSRIEVTDGETAHQLVVAGLSRAHHAVITRTGMVWIVGLMGRDAVIRVAGSHEPWPAWVPRKPREPAPVAVDVDVTALWSRRIRLVAWLPLTVLTMLIVFAGAVIWINPSRMVALTWLILLGPMAAALAVFGRRRFGLGRLPALVNAGPWTMAQASPRPWRARMDDTAEASAMIRLADGRMLTADMRSASVDLLGTVWDTGTLWFAGEPEPGKTMAAGYPGYPLLAVAVIR